MKRQISKSILVLIMCFFALVAIFPILMMLMNSFKTGAELAANAWGLPENWSLTNYKNLLTYSSGQLVRAFGNSIYNIDAFYFQSCCICLFKVPV